jgi:hypothetical protein
MLSITTENSRVNGIDVDALTQAIDQFNDAAMRELSGREGKEIKNCWTTPSARCQPWNVVIGNSTLIRLNKLAMGESFSLSPHVRHDEALVGGWSAVRPALCYDFVRVKKRMLSSPYWLRSPQAESFQPPWLLVADRRWHRKMDAHHTYRDLGNETLAASALRVKTVTALPWG